MKKIDADHALAILIIKKGDLFLTRKNDHDRLPVIGFFEYLEGVRTITSLNSTTAYFMPIQEGSVGIYFRKNILSVRSSYWAKFHEVWIGGRKCVIHEQFINPLPKSKGKSNG